MNGARHCRASGFTLIELLIALALSGIVALLLLNGIGLASAGFDRLSRSADRLERQRSLDALLRRSLGTTAVLPAIEGQAGFVGQPTSLRFLTLAEDAGAGLYDVEIAPRVEGGESVLLLTRRLAEPWAVPRIEQSVLVRRLRRFRLAYFGATGPAEEAKWHDKWVGIVTPPRLVRVTIAAGDAPAPPPIVIRLWGVTP